MNTDNEQQVKDGLVLEENEMVCSLTNRVVKATDKEQTLQSMIAMMAPWVNTVEIVEDFFAPNAFMIPNSLSISFMFVWKKFRDRIMPTMTKHVTIPKITTLAKSLIIAILEEKPLYLPAR